LNGGHSFTFDAEPGQLDEIQQEVNDSVSTEIVTVKHSKGEFCFRAELFSHMQADA
jgi:hypothetical protein